MAAQEDLLFGPGEAEQVLRLMADRFPLVRENLHPVLAEIRSVTNVRARGAADIEKVPDRALSFAEAAERLREHGIDLLKERQDHIRRQIRHGRISADKAAAYGVQFDSVQISERDIGEVIKALKRGEKFFTVFSTGQEVPAEDFDMLLTQAGIRTHEWSRVSGFDNPNRPKGPSVTFTPAGLNVPDNMTGQTADRRLQDVQETGIQYVEPAECMDLFLRSVDNGLQALNPGMDIGALPEEEYRVLRSRMLLDPRMDEYLLDVRTITQFPAWRNSSGRVLGLHFIPLRDYRRVYAADYLPRFAAGYLGPRRSLGRFLPRGEAAKE